MGSMTIAEAAQTGMPVTMEALFPKVTSVSCNGCDAAKSCTA